MQRSAHGLTRVELAIIMAVFCAVAAGAIPSYKRMMIDARRLVARTFLTQIAAKQEQYFSEHKTYAGDLLALGYPTAIITFDGGRTLMTASNKAATYTISLSITGPRTYTIAATPINGQATADIDCGTLTLTQAGQKTASGSNTATCW